MNSSVQSDKSSLTARRLAAWFVGMATATAVVGLACSLWGRVGVPLDEGVFASQIWQLRVVRLAAAALVGAGLAGAGLALQGLLRNPLAEPYILGLSSGAGVGVLLGPSMGATLHLAAWATTPALAMLGALVTAAVVYGIARRRGRLDPYVLLLAGVIVNVFNGAMIMTLLQFTRQEEIFWFVSWGMGRIPEWLWHRPMLLGLCGGMILVGWIALFLRSTAMNMLSLGDDVASTSGVSVQRLRVETFVLVALMTSAAVALAGPIGFVGLIVPHVCRLLLGPDHRRLTIVAGFGGAMFLMLADTLCRLMGAWFQLGEIPVGVITALAGGPFFIVLLRRRAREGLG
ncbi:MAG: iron ABC transporter permease [Phycisphaerae bacterium]|nr:iron ABC transporter permease [Phycisphaerae bacterium]